MKQILSLLLCSLLCMASMRSNAQAVTPKYACSPDNSAGTILSPAIMENIYYPSNFPGMPAGTFTNMYLQVGFIQVVKMSYTYTGFKVSIKSTEATRYIHGGSFPVVKDTMLIPRNANIVANYPTFAVKGPFKQGDWIKIPLNAGNFFYTGTQNFAVQVVYDSVDAGGGFSPAIATNTFPVYRTIAGAIKDSISGTSTANLVNVGFDVAVTGVAGIENVQTFGLFPNPAAGGRFNVSFDAAQSVRQAGITVSDAMGRQVYGRSYTGVGSSFFKEVDISGAAKGIYFVKVEADGEVISRRVVIE